MVQSQRHNQWKLHKTWWSSTDKQKLVHDIPPSTVLIELKWDLDFLFPFYFNLKHCQVNKIKLLCSEQNWHLLCMKWYFKQGVFPQGASFHTAITSEERSRIPSHTPGVFSLPRVAGAAPPPRDLSRDHRASPPEMRPFSTADSGGPRVVPAGARCFPSFNAVLSLTAFLLPRHTDKACVFSASDIHSDV